MTVTIADHDRQLYGRLQAPIAWIKRHDNGCLVSIGLIVGTRGFTRNMFDNARRRYKWQPLTREQWQHSGCLSFCKLRGHDRCGW